MSRVWIINQYAHTPGTGPGLRHHNFARRLAARGHEVHLVMASWTHLSAAEDLPEREEIEGYTAHRIDVPRYAASQDPRRIFNWLKFSHRLRDLPARIGHAPDTIFYTSPSLLGFSGAERLARRLKARLVFEVRDIWPLTLQQLGGLSARHPLIFWMQRVEDRAYRVSDAVISNLPNVVEHMTSRGMNPAKFTWIPNGFSRDAFTEVQPMDRDAAGLPGDRFVVGYTGTIGQANDLGTLLDAAHLLRDRDEIAFAIVGRGSERDRLEARIAQEGLGNVHLLPPIPKDDVPAMLAAFDACHIGLTPDPLFRFGVSPNKLFEYFMAAKPIVYGIDSGDYTPVATSGAGFQVAPGDGAALAEAVAALADLSAEARSEMGEKGRHHALMHHDFDALTDRLEAVLFPTGAAP